jgi:hypothetical protein
MSRCSTLRSELEDQWRERVGAASSAYEFAHSQADAALQLCLGRTGYSAQEFQALQEVQNRESDALDEYLRVLKIFHELVVDGIPPPD